MRGVIRRVVVGVLALLGAGAAGLAVEPDAPDNLSRNRQAFEEIERGRYLAILGDCAPCHTAQGGKPFAGGRPIETPFGILVSPNITSDRLTGIGAWTDEEFLNAVRNGIARDGAHLYPAMPFPYYTKVTRADLLALRAYLDSLAPAINAVEPNQLPFPFNLRASLTVWDALFFTPGAFQPAAGKSDEWNRGAYLVEGLGHCGACHTAKNLLGGDARSRALQGNPLQGWYALDLTGDARTGLAGWSADEIVEYLQTGHNRFSAATGPMSEVISHSTARMTEADLRAIAVYLKDLPDRASATPRPVAATDPAMRAGQAIYVDNCAACHTAAGAGIASLFPMLKASPAVQSADPTSLVRIVLRGAQSVATDRAPTGPSMPAFGWKLSDAQVAAVLTHVRNAWGNVAAPVSADTIRRLRADYAQRSD